MTDKSNIATELRNWSGDLDCAAPQLCNEAAAEIEQLKKCVDGWNEFADVIGFDCPHSPESWKAEYLDKPTAEAERLRGEVEQLRGEVEQLRVEVERLTAELHEAGDGEEVQQLKILLTVSERQTNALLRGESVSVGLRAVDEDLPTLASLKGLIKPKSSESDPLDTPADAG